MNRKSKDKIVVATLSTTMSAAAALIPVLSSIAKVFPDYAHMVHLLVTIPPLMIMISSMLVSPLLKVLSSKKITILGLALIVFSGVYPYFSQSFILLVLSRVIMGLGLGLIVTISSSLPARYFASGKDRDTATGLQSAFSSLGGVLFSFLSGFIANYYWKGVFLVQLLNLIPLGVILLLMRPHFNKDNEELDPSFIEGTITRAKDGNIFVKDAFWITLLAFLCIVIGSTFPHNLSIYIDQKNIGTTNFTGLIGSINAFMGFLIGIMFHRINKGLKNDTLSTSLFILGASFLIVSKALSPFMFLAGSLLFGVGTSLLYPAFLTNIYSSIPDKDIVPAISMYMVATNIAQFVSPFIINNLSSILGVGIEYRFIFASISITILGLIIIFTKKRRMNDRSH